MKQYTRQNNELVEVCGFTEPKATDFETMPAEYFRQLNQYNDYRDKLQHIPIHPDYLSSFEYNKVYDETEFEVKADYAPIKDPYAPDANCLFAILKQKEHSDFAKNAALQSQKTLQKILNKQKETEDELFIWRPVTEIKEINWPLCIQYDGGGAPYYQTVCSIKELHDCVSEKNPLSSIMCLRPHNSNKNS